MIDFPKTETEEKVIKRIISEGYPKERLPLALNLLYKSRNRNNSEALYLLAFNNLGVLSQILKIKEQIGTAIDFSKSDFLEFSSKLRMNSLRNFALTHNHPNQKAEPSIDDLFFTEHVKSIAKDMNKKILDHLIWTKKEIYSYELNKTL